MKSLKSTSHHLEFGNWGEREERRERGKEREWITSINYYVHGGKSSGPKSKTREISWNGHMRGKPISQKCRFVNQLLSTFMFKCHQVISQKPSLHGSQLLPLYSFPLVHILKLVGQSRRKYPKKKKIPNPNQANHLPVNPWDLAWPVWLFPSKALLQVVCRGLSPSTFKGGRASPSLSLWVLTSKHFYAFEK